MTATAILYTGFGYALAADGRQRWGHAPSRDATARESEKESIQKIFKLETGQAVFGCALRGSVANRDRSFDLGVEFPNQIALLRREKFENGHRLVDALSTNIGDYIEAAREEQRIDGYPDVRITCVGYFNKTPHWVEVQFLPSHNPLGSLHWLNPTVPYPGLCVVTGSLLIRDLISHADPRFFEFYRPFDETASLQDAIEVVKNYIEACSSPMALEVDPSCEELGGHIHVATVTHTGFKWEVPPLVTAL